MSSTELSTPRDSMTASVPPVSSSNARLSPSSSPSGSSSSSVWILLALLILLLFFSAFLVSERFFIPFCLSILSGFSTSLGAAIVVSRSSPLTESHLSFTCGLAFGVMMFVSLFDMLFPAMADPLIGAVKALGIFAFGFVVLIVVLKLVPSDALMSMHEWVDTKEEDRNHGKYGNEDHDKDPDGKDVLTTLLPVPAAYAAKRIAGELRTRNSGNINSGDSLLKEPTLGNGTTGTHSNSASIHGNGNGIIHAAKNAEVVVEVNSAAPLSPARAPVSSVPPLPSPSAPVSSFSTVSPSRVLRFGILTAVILGIHNLPEGLAVFISSISSLHDGMVMAFAISLHNIPEGLVVATPIYAATHSKGTAVLWTMLSGVTEPLGALLAVTALRDYLTASGIRNALSFVGGIMSAVSVTELLPEAKRYDRDVEMYKGIVSGVAIMALTWILME